MRQILLGEGVLLLVPSFRLTLVLTLAIALGLGLGLDLALVLVLACSALTLAAPAANQVQFREFWTALAGELDSILLEQIVHRKQEFIQDEVR